MKRFIRGVAVVVNIIALLLILVSAAAPGDQAQTLILAMIGLSLASYHLSRLAG